ncbi:exopolysaccharide biosynthesis protein [Qipengyuania nanhaisediminis]|uniref:exopolysaccharide biosynthesis protein n=1 Tax=Qipengyuania nanhaisediminis TaxID=604088 RepID=UPI0038B323CF
MAQGEPSEPHSIEDVVEGLEDLAEHERTIRVADVLDQFGTRSFAPVMLVLSLLEISPIGVIPGVPTFLALCVAIVAAQLLFGRDHIWLPGWIAERSVSSEKLEKATGKLDKPARKLDGLAKSRLTPLARGPALKVAAGIIIVLCLMVPPLEVLPWASAAPMIAVAIISLAIMVRDGLAMLGAWIVSAGAVGLFVYWYCFTDNASGSLLSL